MRFSIVETGQEITAQHRPVVLITSNNEKELPDAFLRRCIFYYIEFPDPTLMRKIIAVHHPHLDAKLLDQVLIKFYWLREQSELRKKPSTSELIDWISALLRSGVSQEKLEAHIPFIGALLKTEQDVDAFGRYDTKGGEIPMDRALRWWTQGRYARLPAPDSKRQEALYLLLFWIDLTYCSMYETTPRAVMSRSTVSVWSLRILSHTFLCAAPGWGLNVTSHHLQLGNVPPLRCW